MNIERRDNKTSLRSHTIGPICSEFPKNVLMLIEGFDAENIENSFCTLNLASNR